MTTFTMPPLVTTLQSASNGFISTIHSANLISHDLSHTLMAYNAGLGSFLNNTAPLDESTVVGEEVEGEYVPYNKRAETYIVPILFAIIFFVGIIGNGLLIYAVLSHKALRNNAPNIYILNLSIGDFLLILISVPFTSTIYTFESWPYGTVLCKTTEFWRAISVAVSVYTLTALSADRYHAIVDPLGRYVGGRKTVRRTLCTCGAIWLLGAAIASLDAINSYVLVLPRYEDTVPESGAVNYTLTSGDMGGEMMSVLSNLNRGGTSSYATTVPSDPRVAACLYTLIYTGHFETPIDATSLFSSWFPNLNFQAFRDSVALINTDLFTTTPPVYDSKSIDQTLHLYSAPITYLLNAATTTSVAPGEHSSLDLAPLKVCYPYPERYGDGYKRWHTLIKFLLLLVVPFAIITVYYVLMAKRLIMSTTDVPNACYSASSLPICHKVAVKKNFDKFRGHSSPESTKPFMPKLSPDSIRHPPLLEESDDANNQLLPNGYDSRNLSSDETLLTNNKSFQSDRSSFQMASDELQIPPTHFEIKTSPNFNNSKSQGGWRNSWTRMSSQSSPRNSFTALKDKMLEWSSLSKRGVNTAGSRNFLRVSRSQQSMRNSSTCTLSNSPSSHTMANGEYERSSKGSFSYWKRKLSGVSNLTTRNFNYAARANKQMDSRKKVAKMVLIVVLLFLVCWLPHHVFNMWFHFDPHAVDKYNYAWHSLKLIGFILSYLNSCINPIVLYFISKTYHKHFNRYLALRCWREKSSVKKLSRPHSTDTVVTSKFSRQNTFNRTFKMSSSDRGTFSKTTSTSNTTGDRRFCDKVQRGGYCYNKTNGKIIEAAYDFVKINNSPITVKVEYESGTSDSYYDLTIKKPRILSVDFSTTHAVSL